MFECIGVLFFLAVSVGIVWLAFLIGELKETTTNLLGEIKMKQADFEKKIDGLHSKVDALDAKSDAEAAQVVSLVQNYKDEIQRMKDEHPEFDMSRLDALNDKLDASATRIGAIVPDEPTQPETETQPNIPAETVDPLPPTEVEQIPDPVKEPVETSTQTSTEISTETSTESSPIAKPDETENSSDKDTGE